MQCILCTVVSWCFNDNAVTVERLINVSQISNDKVIKSGHAIRPSRGVLALYRSCNYRCATPLLFRVVSVDRPWLQIDRKPNFQPMIAALVDLINLRSSRGAAFPEMQFRLQRQRRADGAVMRLPRTIATESLFRSNKPRVISYYTISPGKNGRPPAAHKLKTLAWFLAFSTRQHRFRYSREFTLEIFH